MLKPARANLLWSLTWGALLWFPIFAHDLFRSATPAAVIQTPELLQIALLALCLATGLGTAPILAVWLYRLITRARSPVAWTDLGAASICGAVILAIEAPSPGSWGAFGDPLQRLAIGVAMAIGMAALATRIPDRVGRSLPIFGLLCWSASVASQFDWHSTWNLSLAVSAAGLAASLCLRPLILISIAAPLLASALTISAADHEFESVNATPKQVNVVILVIDTLRADHTSIGGYALDVTPTLKALAESPRSTTFAAAWSPSASTSPSVKAMFIASSPSVAGSYALINDESPNSLAETFRRSGWQTGLFSSNAQVSNPGFQRGFGHTFVASGMVYFLETWLTYQFLTSQQYMVAMRFLGENRLHLGSGHAVRHAARGWMEDRVRDNTPFMLYLQIVEPHWPYYDRGHGYATQVDKPLSHVGLLMKRRRKPSAPRLREFVSRYDEGIREADLVLAELLADLEEMGIADDTLLIVTGDHGEEFFEHGGFSHGHDIYQEQVHVPFVVRWPVGDAYAAIPKTIAQPVVLSSLLPTLAELLDLERDERWSERSFAPVLRGEAGPPAITETRLGKKLRLGYRTDKYKVRVELTQGDRKTAKTTVFDLVKDPLELEPLAPKRLKRLQHDALEAALARFWYRGETAGEVEDVEEGGIEQLRALGYVR